MLLCTKIYLDRVSNTALELESIKYICILIVERNFGTMKEKVKASAKIEVLRSYRLVEQSV